MREFSRRVPNSAASITSAPASETAASASEGGHDFGQISVLPQQTAAPVQAKSGEHLPAQVKSQMEASLGADFSDVKVHQGQDAPDLGAVAFAQGNDVHFAPGEYDPHTPGGQALLGHELTHVVQQREGRVAQPNGDSPINDDAALEAEADKRGAAAALKRS